MTTNMYEVVFNTCYGGFDYPDEIIDKIFEKFPPDTEVGKKLWKEETNIPFFKPDETPTGNIYRKISDYNDYFHDYKSISYQFIHKSQNIDKIYNTKYVTKDNNTYYSVTVCQFNDEFRTNPEIIQLLKDNDILRKRFNYSELAIAKVPHGYDFDISEYDGMERVEIICPTEKIITDLLTIIETGNRDNLNSLTNKLLAKESTVKDVLYQYSKYSDNEDE